MSAGHGHARPNHRHPDEVKTLMASGGAPELMKRWQRLDVDHDVPDLAGYNVAGTVRYLDRDFFKALLDDDYATEILGEPIDTGMSPEDTVECLLEHEGTEKVLLDADNDVDNYLAAHELATVAEHEKVRAKGGSPMKYERALKAAIAYCEHKAPVTVDKDFACAPMLDSPDRLDKVALRAMQRLGVPDASKEAKAKVGYTKSTGEDQCADCAHWEASPDTGPDLSRCETVCGLVRRDRWCKKFEDRDEHGEGNGLQARRGADRQERERVEGERGSNPGVGDAQGEPSSQEGEPEPQEGEVTGGPDFASFGEKA